MSDSETSALAAHPDVRSEQALIDHAYECLRFMRERAVYLKSLGYLGGNIHADTGLTPEMAAADDARKQRRINALAEPATALCFGRIDRGDERFYIGRRHVEDQRGDSVVTDWRVPVAVGFYRATIADRMGLRQRRRFVAEGRALLDIFEEDLEHPDADAAGAYVPDPLLAEVGRARTGTMRDIVATIQGEQDAIIRAPLDECIVVQGGPGTGKTAVGLHRVAFLLYTHREQLERERVLIVGPNRIFFRYISQVLPSLGETAGVQLTIEGLTSGRFPVRGEDAPSQARLKGDARMAVVVRNAALDRMAPAAAGDITLNTAFGRVTLEAADVDRIATSALDSGRPLNDARASVRDQLVDLAWRGYRAKHESDPSAWATFVDRVRMSPDFKKALDKRWPTLSASDLVRKLYGNRRLLDRATRDVLTEDERDLLARKPAARLNEERWTTADAAILDEADAVLNRTSQQYGHIIVDEAQDLSPMQLRIIARRARRGSMTILGDLAQATVPGGQTRWADAIDMLAAPTTRYEELTVGYRVPAPILEFANRLMPIAAPGLRPTTSARTRGQSPRLIATDLEGRATAVASEASALAARWTSTAIVVPDSLRQDTIAALTAAGLEFSDGQKTSELGEHVTLLTPATTKGLEFDAVLVVEPSRIVDEDEHGIRLLYVVLTRAVQELAILHAEHLPAALAAGTAPSA